MTTFHIKNFRKNNTPRWAEQIGNFALIVGGICSAIAASCAGLEALPAETILIYPMVNKMIVFGKVAGVYGALICGGVKFFSKMFGIPLKDL